MRQWIHLSPSVSAFSQIRQNVKTAFCRLVTVINVTRQRKYLPLAFPGERPLLGVLLGQRDLRQISELILEIQVCFFLKKKNKWGGRRRREKTSFVPDACESLRGAVTRSQTATVRCDGL